MDEVEFERRAKTNAEMFRDNITLRNAGKGKNGVSKHLSERDILQLRRFVVGKGSGGMAFSRLSIFSQTGGHTDERRISENGIVFRFNAGRSYYLAVTLLAKSATCICIPSPLGH